MAKQHKKPELRFNGFEEDWEECFIENLGTWDKGQRMSKEDIKPEGGNACIHYGELFSYSEIIPCAVSKTSLQKQIVSTGNELLFPDSDVTPDGLGRCSTVLQEGVILGSGINILRLPLSKYAPFYSLCVTKNRKQIIDKVTGSTVRHIHPKDLNEVELYETHNFSEQQKIGEFFMELDELIKAKEQEVEKLRQIKQALLDKMFPNTEPHETETGGVNLSIDILLQTDTRLVRCTPSPLIPAIRFRGYSKKWENKTFGDYGAINMCKRIMKYQTSEKGDVPFFKIGTFGGTPDAYIPLSLFLEYKQKYPYPRKGDILVSAAGTIGRVVEFSGENEYFQDSNIVWLNHNQQLDNSFLKVLYSVVKWNGLEGSTLKRLYNNNFLQTQIVVPSDTDEQFAIGQFFREQDNTIYAVQAQIIRLRNIKQACLQKMFA